MSNYIYQGTAPTHTYELPFETDLASVVRVIYRQGTGLKFVKTGDDLTLNGTRVELRLTQEETLSFATGSLVQSQVRVLTQGGDPLQSQITNFIVKECLEDEVI